MPGESNSISTNNSSLFQDPYVGMVAESVSKPLTQAPSARSRFGSIMGGIAKVAGNIFLPGVGGALGNLMNGGIASMGGNFLDGSTKQYLEYQQKMLQEQRSFEMIVTIQKNRHDAAMSAIRNMKAS